MCEERVVVAATLPCAGQDRLETDRLGHLVAPNVEGVNDGTYPRQRHVGVETEAREEHLECDPVADVGELGTVEVEARRRRRAVRRASQP